jgi:hypothetical protein
MQKDLADLADKLKKPLEKPVPPTPTQAVDGQGEPVQLGQK